MKAWEVLGYSFDGEVYCVSCMRKHRKEFGCTCNSRDENRLCDSNCHGYGPNPIFAGDEFEESEVCGDCGCEVVEEPEYGETGGL